MLQRQVDKFLGKKVTVTTSWGKSFSGNIGKLYVRIGNRVFYQLKGCDIEDYIFTAANFDRIELV